MRIRLAFAGIFLAIIAGATAPFLLHAQGEMPQNVNNGGQDQLALSTARRFAPFLRAVVTRRMNVAERIFKVRRSVNVTLDQADTARILGRFIRPDQLELSLIGGRTLGQNMGILLFTVVTEDGPVAFKVYHYGFGNDIYIARMDITDDWDEIERLSAMVDILGQPITVPLSGQIDAQGAGGGGQ
jgi:hypothetical protein